LRSKYILGSTIGMSVFLGIVLPAVIVLVFLNVPTSSSTTFPWPIPTFIPGQNILPADWQVFLMFLYGYLSSMHLMIPAALPLYIAADSFAGERERKTIEPLIAAPLTESELLMGKILTSFIPTVICAYGSYVLTVIVVNALLFPQFGMIVFPNLYYLILEVAAVPLIIFTSVLTMVLVSSKVQRVREATQLGGFVVLPIVVLLFGQLFGLIVLNIFTLIIILAVFTLADLALFKVAKKVFNREKLLTSSNI